MKDCTYIEAIRWKSITDRNNEIEKWFLHKDNSNNNTSSSEVKFANAQEAINFMKENKNNV